jgi:hypothetical protein
MIAAWVLVYFLNGQEIRSGPLAAEECLMVMLTRPNSQMPYCAGPDGKRMRAPEQCETIKGWPLYCKPVQEMARK